MLNSKVLKIILLLTTFIFFTACGGSKKMDPQPSRHLDLRGKSESFISGANDGCETAYIKYKKDHEAFNNDFQYNEGWWIGRHNCEGREIYDEQEE